MRASSAILWAGIFLGGATLPAQDAASDAKRLLRTYCGSCHGSEKPRGDFTLDPLLGGEVRDRMAAWQSVFNHLVERDMPPPKAKVVRPSAGEYGQMLGWLKKEIAGASAALGRTTRRLNRAEYNNTIRDLLYIDFRPADAFPQDLGLGGFDNIAEAQSVSPFLMEKYVRAARESIAMAIVRVPEPKPVRIRGFPMSHNQREGKVEVRPSDTGLDPLLKKKFHLQYDPHLQFFSMDWASAAGRNKAGVDGNGSVREGKGAHGYEVVLPHDGKAVRRAEMWFENALPLGRYRTTVRAYAEPARDREPTGACIMGLTVNSRRVSAVTVEVGTEPKVYEFEFMSDRKQNKVVFAAASSVNKKDLPGIPALILCEAQLEGPILDGWPPRSHRSIFGDDGKTPVDEVLRAFISRAFRRPARPEEVSTFAAIVESEAKAGAKPADALAAALEAVLVSPNFLFLVEAPGPGGRLEPHALASRLSYFLWSSMPDEGLLRKAGEGRLDDPATLVAETSRMIRDPKSVALVENFASLWIGTRRISELAPDPLVFKDWDEDLRKAMAEEPVRFFEHVLRENGSVLSFLDSDFTFANERLARHYGWSGVKGGEFRKVALRPEDHRGGLVTQAAVLTLGAQPTRSSPVFRGKFIFEKLFNRPPPNPPPDIPALSETVASRSPRNLREQLEIHARDPKCASCHVKIDPWGLPLEGFDGIGAWRGGSAEDVSSVLDDGRALSGDRELKQELLRRGDEFVRGLTEKLLMVALGRVLRLEDKEAIPGIVLKVREDGYRFHTLFREIVLSAPFRSR